jgi:uncharacterized lipoprotein NlpE involved in copper resistance
MSSAIRTVMQLGTALAMAAVTACAAPKDVPLQPDTASALGTFAGILPCVDCAGIRTELTLYAEHV